MAKVKPRPEPAGALGDAADLLYAKFMSGLADPTRLRIVRFLLDGPRPAGEIVAHLGLSQSRVSNHLACLKWCGYVDTLRQGRNVIYRLTDRRIRKLLELAQAVVSDNAAHIAACTRIRVQP
ncbi:ArsR family transcriptional regulator [bacterium]|nr:MAG: ArsR family transcriptional regulator [bacterium]